RHRPQGARGGQPRREVPVFGRHDRRLPLLRRAQGPFDRPAREPHGGRHHALHVGHDRQAQGRASAAGRNRPRHRVRHGQPVALAEETRKKYDVSAWTHVIHAAAPCPVEIKKRMLEWWGPTIYEYYAATEGGGTLVTPEEWVKKPGTVGKPWPISEVKILDDEGNELPPNEVGTVWMSMGADRSFEYYKDKEKTDQTFRENFFTVGDAG